MPEKMEDIPSQEHKKGEKMVAKIDIREGRFVEWLDEEPRLPKKKKT